MLILNTPLGKRPIIDVKILNGQMWLAADISTYQPMRKWYNQKTLRPLNPPLKVEAPAPEVKPQINPRYTPDYLKSLIVQSQALHSMITRTNAELRMFLI